MLRISKLTDYSTVILHQLASMPHEPHSASSLAMNINQKLPENQQVGIATVSKVLKTLQESNLVCSSRGANGGYMLAKPASNISIADIVTAMEGSVALTECSTHPGLCNQESTCAIRGNWQLISFAIQRLLAEISLEDMASSLRMHPVIMNTNHSSNGQTVEGKNNE